MGLDPLVVAAVRPVVDGKFGNVTIFDREVFAIGSVIALGNGCNVLGRSSYSA